MASRSKSLVTEQESILASAIACQSSLSAIRKCDMRFLPEREAANMRLILNEPGDTPVLTMAVTPTAQDAAISLVLEGRHLMFDINVQRARSAHLKFSSKLLQLARTLQ